MLLGQGYKSFTTSNLNWTLEVIYHWSIIQVRLILGEIVSILFNERYLVMPQLGASL
jgi:hypothetical protein